MTRAWLPWTVLVLVATSVPEVLARAFGPRDLERVHSFLNIWDFNVYLAAMREAARSGAWLVHNPFAIESHVPQLVHVPYVLVGQIARALGADVLSVYSVAEALGRVLVVLAIAAFVSVFVSPGRARLIAFLLATFGSGLSLWVGLGGALAGASGVPTEYLYYETNTLTILFSGLHLMLALPLTVALVALLGRLEASRVDWWALVGLALASGLLALIHPYSPPALLTAFGAYAVVGVWRHRVVPWRLALGLALVALAAAPPLAYDFVTFTQDPLWSGSYLQQKVQLSPGGLGLISHLGLPLLLAPVGLAVWRDGGRRRVLAGALILATLAWMYAPLGFQRRFAFGIPLYLSVPAAVAVDWLLDRLPRPREVWRRALVYGLILGAGGTSAAMYVGVLSSAVTGRPYPSYPNTAAEARAAEWLAQRMQADQVVLSALESGYLLGGTIPGRVAVGHTHETPDFARKRDLVQRFFGTDTGPDQRLAIARTLQADFVFYGPHERQLGPAPRAPTFELLYDRAGVAIYRVGDG